MQQVLLVGGVELAAVAIALPDERETALALEGLAAGAYFYSVEREEVMRFGKVVVE